MQQESPQSEQCDQSVSDFVKEAVRLASFQDTSNSISGCSYRPQVVSDCKLGLVRVHMLQDWLQPQQGMVWSEQRVISKLQGLKLPPEQQSTVDTGVRVDQFGLVRSHSQPFNNLKRQLIKSISCSHQAATLLMANSDHMAGHRHTINQALKHATSEAFYQVKKR